MPLLQNGSWVPIELDVLDDPSQNASWRAYLNEMWMCDRLASVKDHPYWVVVYQGCNLASRFFQFSKIFKKTKGSPLYFV